jgi:hypothetical protein
MSRRTGRGGRPRHPEHRGGPRPYDPTRLGAPAAPAAPGLAGPPTANGGRAVPEPRPIEPAAAPVKAAEVGPRPDPAISAIPRGVTLDRTSARAVSGGPSAAAQERQGGCTTAQLRRFIKSRAYVPMHEIRRRFLIAAEDDDVSGIELETGRVFVGLPEREGQMLGELLRGGEVGYELQLDPVAPVVVGVYPMRPVTRN